MKVIAVIPARLASTRFPGKPLAKINGVPMVGHCYYRAKLCKDLDEVFIATCDEEIATYSTSIGAKVIMTNSNHNRATDRTAEAVSIIESRSGKLLDIVVMIQGDEPMVTPSMISRAVNQMVADNAVKVVNLMSRVSTAAEIEDPNEVKVVVDLKSNALYYSREPIPSNKLTSSAARVFKQVCVIPFRRASLDWFNGLEETPLEVVESVDMLRIIENGENVRMVLCDESTYSVDTPEDLQKVTLAMLNDPFVSLYKSMI